MIGFTFKEVKIAFNEKAVLTPAEKFQTKLRKQSGAYCRTVMRNSIKPGRRGQVSQPGQPPLYHANKRVNYRDTIFFVDDTRQKRVFIGAVLLDGASNGGQPVPGNLEHSGVSMRWVGHGANRRRQPVNVRARPHAVPAFEKTVKRLPDLMRGGIMREV